MMRPPPTPRDRGGASIPAGIRRLALATLGLAGACAGQQSALAPAGRASARIADLFWWMTAGSLFVWVVVFGLSVYAGHRRGAPHDVGVAKKLIVVGGVAFPVVVLTILLTYGLAIMPSTLAPAPHGSLTVLVTGEQWWWRVRYRTAPGGTVDLANEIHLPVGEPVEFELESRDVIHSFWIPALGGKADMIPGRRTRLRLDPTKTGVFRGVCAEYCGTSHAFMSFSVVVEEKEAFASWLARQAEPAVSPTDADAARGGQLFLANGCGACHTIRGTRAAGVLGPDLTHVGSRRSLAAGRLGNEAGDFNRFIAHTTTVKPNVLMPAFDMLPPAHLRALGAYLDDLK